MLDRLLQRGWPLIAADGGANQLHGGEIVPHAIIGDLDSLQAIEYWQQRCDVVPVQEQDTTDFEKCLYSVDAPLYICAGFTGKRIDHTLAAIHSAHRYVSDKQILLLGSDDILWVRGGNTMLHLEVGTRVSVYPLTTVRFRQSSGLQYPLDGLTMQSGLQIGTSNTSTAENVSIELAADTAGQYLLILPIEQLHSLLRQLIAESSGLQ